MAVPHPEDLSPRKKKKAGKALTSPPSGSSGSSRAPLPRVPPHRTKDRGWYPSVSHMRHFMGVHTPRELRCSGRRRGEGGRGAPCPPFRPHAPGPPPARGGYRPSWSFGRGNPARGVESTRGRGVQAGVRTPASAWAGTGATRMGSARRGADGSAAGGSPRSRPSAEPRALLPPAGRLAHPSFQE